jgi:hypothetical protein
MFSEKKTATPQFPGGLPRTGAAETPAFSMTSIHAPVSSRSRPAIRRPGRRAAEWNLAASRGTRDSEGRRGRHRHDGQRHRALTLGAGWPLGPCALLDLVGIDVHVHASRALYDRLSEARMAPPPRLVRMLEARTLGRKSGEGFFRYD